MVSVDKSFHWEKGPFTDCPACGTGRSFGFFSIGGRALVMRCTQCRHSERHSLPELNKTVIYLDQFAVSELFKLQAGTRREDPHTPFWQEANELIRRVVHLQQAAFPHSDVHHTETIISPWPIELRKNYERISGELSFDDTDHIQLRQVAELAESYIEGREPHFTFDVDDALKGTRNNWLPDMRVSLNTDYSSFAGATRASKAETGARIVRLMDEWRSKGIGFDEVLELELGSYYSSRVEGLRSFAFNYQKARAEGDFIAELDAGMSPVIREMAMLRRVFARCGVPEDQIEDVIMKFWMWPGNRHQPYARIASYLFAALAGQVKARRVKPVSAGFINDVRAIAAYAPYVDAMLVDKECATLLQQGRPLKELSYRARIFSLNSKDQFLAFLRGLETAASEQVRRYASIAYGV